MNILEEIIRKDIYIDLKESTKEDIYTLSDMFEYQYPDISNNSTFFYPTIKSFYDKYGTDDDVCFYNRPASTWDGYKTYKAANGNGLMSGFSAAEIIAMYEGTNFSDVSEDDVMKMFVEA